MVVFIRGKEAGIIKISPNLSGFTQYRFISCNHPTWRILVIRGFPHSDSGTQDPPMSPALLAGLEPSAFSQQMGVLGVEKAHPLAELHGLEGTGISSVHFPQAGTDPALGSPGNGTGSWRAISRLYVDTMERNRCLSHPGSVSCLSCCHRTRIETQAAWPQSPHSLPPHLSIKSLINCRQMKPPIKTWLGITGKMGYFRAGTIKLQARGRVISPEYLWI